MTKTLQIQKKVAEKIRELRLERRWTQADLAKLLGISQNRLSELERDKGSFSAEQLILLLETFNVPLSYFVSPTHQDASSEIQNALTRLGAFHLKESQDVLPSERLQQTNHLIRETLIAAESSRQITALLPVFVRNALWLNGLQLRSDFEKLGALNRLGWLLENFKEALKTEGGLHWRTKYGDAPFALALMEQACVVPPKPDAPEDILEPELRGVGEKTLQEVRRERSPLSKKWRILTRIQPRDFIHALKEATTSPKQK